MRVVACGSVDDGKSTLIGRLLHDSGHLTDDERAALVDASALHGTRGSELDYALLLDGLAAEREQGITIDVAWRHLETAGRRFLIADCPGHVQYTRNFASGASTADLAIVLVDVTRGLVPQTLRHTAVAALLGVRHVLLAVNKMDRVEYAEAAFDAVCDAYRNHAAQLGIDAVVGIPVAAALGDNVICRSEHTAWYRGPSVLEHLEAIEVPIENAAARVPIQAILRDASGNRWLGGTLAGGHLSVGERVGIEPAGTPATIRDLLVAGVEVETAHGGDAVSIRLIEDVDAGRGDILGAVDVPAVQISDQIVADVMWFATRPLVAGRRYLLKLATRTVGARVGELRHRFDPESLQPLAARRLAINDLGAVTLSLDTAIPFLPYSEDRGLGGFILIDPLTRDTVGAGVVRHGLRRADNLRWQRLDVNQRTRAATKGHRSMCVWFTGLSGAGKSTIANHVERLLEARGCHTYLLDGDNLRHGLNRDLGFTETDRLENQRRVSEVARLMTDAGLIVLVSLISPFRAERAAARQLFEAGDFIEVFVDTPLEEAERRDPKGLYAKARRGELPNFTGIDSPYEAPRDAELVLDTMGASLDELARRVVDRMQLND
ncbi:MAG: adenylyl-sulfate kinase [Luteimonas sp.]